MATHSDVPQDTASGWSRDFARDYEASFGHHPGVPVRPGVPKRAANADSTGAVIDQMTAQMQARIAEVERRHGDALRDMQIKLERMSGEAVKARGAVPADLANAFGRIEQGMAKLADRVAETAQPRRRGAETFVFGTPKADATHFVFNPKPHQPVAPVSIDPPGGRDPWDTDQAEALAGLYESGAAGFGAPLPGAALFAHEGHLAAVAQPAPVEASVAVSAPALVAGLGDDRGWLDARLNGLTEQVAKSIEAARPGAALETMMQRVDQLEARFGSALDGLATKADLTSLKPSAAMAAMPATLVGLEAQIRELAAHIDTTQQHLGRLDVIEQHLSDLHAFAQASMDAEPDAAGVPVPAHAAPTMEELGLLADLAVERAMARMPAVAVSGHVPTAEGGVAQAETKARIDAVHGLLNEFAAERRKGDVYTTGMLETVQEALVRLIDRVDAIDAGQARSARATPAVMPPREMAEQPAGEVRQAMPPAAEPVQKVAAEGGTGLQRRREPRRIEPAAVQPIPELAVPLPVVETAPEGQPEISIKDVKLKQRRVPIAPAPEPKVAEPAIEPAAAEAAAPERRVRKAAGPAASGTSKRGIMVAAAALGLVGVSYLASLLLADKYGPALPVDPAVMVPKAMAPAVPAVPARGVVTPVPAAAAAPAAVSPPGMVGPPVRMQPQQSGEAPTRPMLRDQNGGPQQRPSSEPQRPAAGAAVLDTQVPKPGQPATVPETVSDDLSQLDIDSPMTEALPSVAEIAPQTAPMRQGAFQPMPGMSLDTSKLAQVGGNPASAQRQAYMAATSERVGAMAQPASDFGGRFGAQAAQPPAPARPAATQAPTNAITTGSNPEAPARAEAVSYGGAGAAPQAPIDTAVTENVNEVVEMPPALVGPLSLRMAAAKGDKSAAFEVATRFAEGRGIKQDFKQAMTWYQRSATKGFAVAQYRLGTLYERGLGTPVDAARARIWYKRAAEQGNVKAMHNMAVLSAGNGQTPPDYVGAAKWFRDAAERGLADSQFNLGVLNENGLGIPKDAKSAYVWFSLAARGGDAEAARRRDGLLATLDANTLKLADEQVRGWRARAVDTKVNDARVAGDQWRQQGYNQQEPTALPQQVPQLPQANATPAPTGSAAVQARVIKAPAR